MITPLVSAVIPTCRRPAIVPVAVRSVLAQTHPNLEVIVVLAAGRDPETETALAALSDRRVRLVTAAGGTLNPSQARNRGVAEAGGRWVAFLDDDDLWAPAKIARQLEAAEASRWPHPVISCLMTARSRQGVLLWPRRTPAPGEPIGDYLFRRRGLFGGGGFLQSSTLFASRDLWTRVPFREDLAKAEDLDWALRADREPGTGFEFAGTEPLVEWNIVDDRPRASTAGSWRGYAEWIDSARDWVSEEAYASYLLTWVSADAAREGGGWRAFFELWRRARQRGKPSALDLAVHAGHWIAPERLRRTVSARLLKLQRGGRSLGKRGDSDV